MSFTLRPQAEKDIVEAVTYVADRNPSAARRLRVELLETMRRLRTHPHKQGSSFGVAVIQSP
jgi:plasmid stabilization system protein ParE